ncbi:SEL1-like repeat protein [Undibacterium curvum]|uniref:Sel1 repeat family protein n=1 Tax=Undibacterium curvum TaxID=2762294 RepID=A0ABR7A9C8_9BURK|nr:tetratricopeptide repeat protein [Undibacterium curvum]MBC3933456.1 sel1 repeat family protein [Undibacterium curvum]
MRRTLILLCCLLITTLTGCPMKSTLPRNMELKAFDPHRQDFVCVHEADQVPPIDPQAEAWFQEGMRITSRDLPPNQRNYPKAAELWQQAADKQHWKAILNLAGLLTEGDGYAPYEIAADPERAVRLVEQGMQLGIPSAFDLMGSLHQNGAGVNGDASRAYAFWELAAYKGSPGAQTFLGKALSATYDNPQEGFWGNRKTGLRMLECAFAQGYGKAALRLGVTLVGKDKSLDEDYSRALIVLHEGVKMGCEDCANYLSSSFRAHDDPLTNNFKDSARSERYSALGDALYHNPDLKFPNLDKVLPLPPAQLPVWNGNKEDLVNAAKAVVTPPPKLPPHSNSAN